MLQNGKKTVAEGFGNRNKFWEDGGPLTSGTTGDIAAPVGKRAASLPIPSAPIAPISVEVLQNLTTYHAMPDMEAFVQNALDPFAGDAEIETNADFGTTVQIEWSDK